MFNRSPPTYGLNNSPGSGDSQASDDYDHSPSLPSPSDYGERLPESFTLNQFKESSDIEKIRHRFRQQYPAGPYSNEEELSISSEGASVQSQVQ